MNVHKNARLTPFGRAVMVSRIEGGWPVRPPCLKQKAREGGYGMKGWGPRPNDSTPRLQS
jgi:hypothetical protein